jgi:pimeloyl-ACP methyl ester carboxylesterase
MNDPTWLDRAAYPFESHFLELDAGRMHYLDEGQGPPLLLVHGTPTWSFLYRHIVAALRPRFRCIVPDHIGFGLSDKPADWGYRPADHARNLRMLIEHLNLRNFTLVVHDFGGPIGLAYAIERPDNVARLVLFNTFMWSIRDDPAKRRPARLFGTALGRLLYTRMNFSPRVILPAAWGDKATLTPEIRRHYTAVHQRPDERNGMWGFARELLGSSDWFDGLWAQRDRIKDLPALLMWGMNDPAFTARDLARWQALFTDAQTVTFPHVGHFVPDEAGPAAAQEIAAFLDKRAPAPHVQTALHAGVE